MKGKFDGYILWPLAKKFQNWIVDLSTARDFTVFIGFRYQSRDFLIEEVFVQGNTTINKINISLLFRPFALEVLVLACKISVMQCRTLNIKKVIFITAAKENK